ncbi:MAG: pseudouridine synthase [Caldimicrobium sp.]
MQVKIRLDKFLSLAGLGSRRSINSILKSKQVRVNGVIITSPHYKIDPEKDYITYKEVSVSYKNFLYYKMYKPVGVITSTKDKDTTVMDILPKDLLGYKGIFPAGRLDKDAEGLLILTNDGELAHRITHPKWKVPKIYEIIIDKPLQKEDKSALEEGVLLKEGKTLPTQIEYLDNTGSNLKITVYEGRYHLIKRIFKKLGYRVLKIKRIAIGNVFLEDLKPGEIRLLSPSEIESLKKALRLR